MSKKYAFLFPGQGAQAPGMMKDICAASRPATACLFRFSETAGEDISKLLWETDAETLSRTDRSQLAILSASLIAAAALEEVGIVPSAAAGFSLGEFSALYASGVLSFEDAVRVVK
ncbi:ACP S-malonyltransferase, partial [Treponema endosymbiont of Eucomonympha sp.]